MNLLLDTHIALWAITDSPRLSQEVRELVLSPRSVVWVSAASLWEITIKYRLGRGGMPVSGREAMGYFQASGFQILSIEPEHVVVVDELPDHHQDPFDRILVAQAMVEPMRLITHDATVALYSDSIMRV